MIPPRQRILGWLLMAPLIIGVVILVGIQPHGLAILGIVISVCLFFKGLDLLGVFR